MLGRVLSVALTWFAAERASGQEALYVRLPSEVASARAIGFAGALTGLGGDVSAMASNPASLVAVPRSLDVTAALGNAGAYAFGGAVRPLRTLAFGVLLPTTDTRVPLVHVAGPVASERLEPQDGRHGGLAMAWKPERRVALGALVEWQKLRLIEGDRKTDGRGWLGYSFGIFIQPDEADGTRFGIAYRKGADETFTLEGPARTVRVRRPDVFSFGAAWRYGWVKNRRIVATLQPELVRYPDVVPGAERNDLDLRAGLEAWFPFGPCVSGCGGLVQVRGGIISRSAIPTLSASTGRGYDPGRRSTSWTAGASVAPAWPLKGKLKLDGAYSREHRVWVVGLAYRFPTAFRGDLQHHRGRK